MITPAEADAIVAQGWLDAPGLAGQRLFLERGGQLYLAHRDDGACVFLDADGRCGIHGRFGFAAKPLACRAYPFMPLPVGDTVRLDLRFDCPSVAVNQGRPLAAQRAEIAALVGSALTVTRLDPVPVRAELTWPQEALDQVTAIVESLLSQDGLCLTGRIAAAVNLVAGLDTPRLSEITADEVQPLLATTLVAVSRMAQQDPLHRRRLPSGVRTMFRQLLGLYGRVDRLAQPVSPWTRSRQAAALAWGRGRVPALRGDWPRVRFAALEGAWGPLDAEVEAVFTRFYRLKLGAQAFCGVGFFGYPYLAGLQALWLTYPALLWCARLFAAGDGRHELRASDAERALQVIDHRHGRSPQMALPGEQRRLAALCERETLRALIVAYGT
jgi:lysine-N-methylase